MEINIPGTVYNGFHDLIIRNRPTCYIDYKKEFIVHVMKPAYGHMNSFWYYPCFFNNKKVILIAADRNRLGTANYGIWGTHYI